MLSPFPRARPRPARWPSPPVRRRLGNAAWPGHKAEPPGRLQIPACRGAGLHPSLAPACFLPARGGGNINTGISGGVGMLPPDRLRRGAEAAPG